MLNFGALKCNKKMDEKVYITARFCKKPGKLVIEAMGWVVPSNIRRIV